MSIRSEQGIAAVGTVVMLMVVLSVLVTALWQYGMFQITAAGRNQAYLQATYLAHAGAEAARTAWLDKTADEKLEGPLARVYYSEAGGFQLDRPEQFLGYIDVMIETIEGAQAEYPRTRIVSTAHVSGISRTLSLTTFPQVYGHQDELNLYDRNSGRISGTNQYIDRYLIIEPGLENAELHFNPAIRSQSARFSARAVAFEKSIDFAQGGTASASLLVISRALGLTVAKTLVVEAEYVFFKDITLLYAEPSVDPLAPPAQYSLVLRIPAGRGQEIGGQRYWEVYFDGGSVAKKQFVWSRGPGILDYMLTGSGYEPEEIHTYEGVPLAGNAFYFRDGTDLLNPGPGQLIPIPDEKQKRNEAFKDLFIWE